MGWLSLKVSQASVGLSLSMAQFYLGLGSFKSCSYKIYIYKQNIKKKKTQNNYFLIVNTQPCNYL